MTLQLILTFREMQPEISTTAKTKEEPKPKGISAHKIFNMYQKSPRGFQSIGMLGINCNFLGKTCRDI